jgi:hypothetical protein
MIITLPKTPYSLNLSIQVWDKFSPEWAPSMNEKLQGRFLILKFSSIQCKVNAKKGSNRYGEDHPSPAQAIFDVTF